MSVGATKCLIPGRLVYRHYVSTGTYTFYHVNVAVRDGLHMHKRCAAVPTCLISTRLDSSLVSAPLLSSRILSSPLLSFRLDSSRLLFSRVLASPRVSSPLLDSSPLLSTRLTSPLDSAPLVSFASISRTNLSFSVVSGLEPLPIQQEKPDVAIMMHRALFGRRSTRDQGETSHHPSGS